MKTVSILNNVIGPIMPGPSSSHTAGPYHIGKMCRHLLGDAPKSVTFTFAPGSSIAEVYHEEGSDLALVMGTLDLPLTDPRFRLALDLPVHYGVEVKFVVEPFPEADHPNSIKIESTSTSGKKLSAIAKSVGGGAVIFPFVENWSTNLTGDVYHLLVEMEEASTPVLLGDWEDRLGRPVKSQHDHMALLSFNLKAPLSDEDLKALRSAVGVTRVWYTPPVFFPIKGDPIFTDAAGMVAYAEEKGLTLGETAVAYEAALLGLDETAVNEAMGKRLSVMEKAVTLGFSDETPPMLLLHPKARKVWEAETEGRLPVGGVHARAAARAMAAMQVNSGNGIVCAAPTGGSAGVLPGVMLTLLEDLKVDRDKVLKAMWAAGAAGLILAIRGTFAAEVAGCQVEIGAAGAMASAGIVEAFDGTPRQAADAACIVFQNAMGLVCDLVQAVVEIPCHTRNASFASQAFLCAELALGGYDNPIPLDDTVDAVYAVGTMLPEELLCTSRGGIAVTPSALAMKKLR